MKFLLKLLGAFLALIVLLTISGGLYVANFDINEHRDEIAEEFLQRTGHSLALGDNLEFTLYPWLGVTLNNVTIGNQDGFGDLPLLTADHAALRVKLLPLLNSEFEIDTVVLHGVSINLVVNADGQSNWSDLNNRNSTGAANQSANRGSPLMGKLVLGGVDVRDVSLQLEDRSTNVRYQISDLRLQTGPLVYGQAIDLELSLQANASQPAIDAVVGLQGTILYDIDNGRYELAPLQINARLAGPRVPGGSTRLELATALRLDLDADTLTVSNLELSAPDSRLTATINGRGVQSDEPVYETGLSLEGSDLAMLFRLAEIEPLASQLSELGKSPFNLRSEISTRPRAGSVAVNALQASLLGSSFAGDLQLDALQSSAPVIQGNLTASGPNLPSVVEVLGQVSGGRNSKLAEAGREMQQIGNKTFSVSSNFNFNASSGVANIPQLEVTMLGAKISGNLDASALNTDRPTVRGKLNAAGDDLPLLMQIAGWFQNGVESPLFQIGDQLTRSRNKTFKLDTEFDAELQQGNIQVPVLNASGLGLSINGNLTAQNMNNSRGTVNGSLTLSGSNLRALLEAAGQAELAEVVQGIEATVQVNGSRSDLRIDPLRFNATLSGSRIPNSPVTVALNAPVQINLDRESLTVPNFTLAGLGLDTRGSLEVANAFSTASYQGRFASGDVNLRRLLQQLNQPVPQTSDPGVLQTVSLTTGFDGSASHFNLLDVNLILDDSAARGNLAITDLAQPAIRFDLSVTELDVDRYLAPTGSGSSATAANNAAPLPVDTLRTLNVQGELTVDRLRYSGLAMDEFSLALNMNQGDVMLSPLRSNLYGGSLEGSLRLDARPAVPTLTLNASMQQVQLGPLMTDMTGAAQITGSSVLQLALTGNGNDVPAIKHSLSGNGRVAVENGILNGVDVGSVLSQVETLLRSRQLTEIQRGQQTAFESFNGTLTVNQGIVSSNDLLIRAPGFQVTGRGTIANLNNNSIDYNLLTSVDRGTATRNTQQYDIGGYSVPIACSGTLSSPRCLPDVGEIARSAVQRQVEDTANRLINRALDRLRDN